MMLFVDLILYTPVINFSVMSGQVFRVEPVLRKDYNVSCSWAQCSDEGEAGTCNPSVSSQALYHWATALPGMYDEEYYSHIVTS